MSSQDLELTLHCDSRQACDGACGLAQCQGSCVDDRFDSVDHCGACGQACAVGGVCDGGSCECPPGQQECNGACVDIRDDPNHCGACGNACASGGCYNYLCACFAAGDCSAAQTCVEYEYSGSSVVDACVDYSGFRIRGGGKQGFLEHNINGQWLPSCASFGPTSAFIVADLVCSDLFGTSGYAEERDAATMSRYYPLADCPEGATSFDDCSVVLDYSCTFDDFVYVMCN